MKPDTEVSWAHGYWDFGGLSVSLEREPSPDLPLVIPTIPRALPGAQEILSLLRRWAIPRSPRAT